MVLKVSESLVKGLQSRQVVLLHPGAIFLFHFHYEEVFLLLGSLSWRV
jgi:hypothetical protein